MQALLPSSVPSAVAAVRNCLAARSFLPDHYRYAAMALRRTCNKNQQIMPSTLGLQHSIWVRKTTYGSYGQYQIQYQHFLEPPTSHDHILWHHPKQPSMARAPRNLARHDLFSVQGPCPNLSQACLEMVDTPSCGKCAKGWWTIKFGGTLFSNKPKGHRIELGLQWRIRAC